MFDVRLTKANLFHFISNKNIFWMNDRDIVKNLTFRGNFTRFKGLQYFLSNRQNILLAIYVNKIHVGNCGFYNILNNSSEFRIVFGEKRLWGKGLSKLMLKKALLIAKSYNIKTVNLEVFENNTPAIRLYESCGFKFVDCCYINNRISRNYTLIIE